MLKKINDRIHFIQDHEDIRGIVQRSIPGGYGLSIYLYIYICCQKLHFYRIDEEAMQIEICLIEI